MTNIFKLLGKVFTEFRENTAEYFKSNKEAKLTGFFEDWTLWEKSWLAVSTVAIVLASIWTWDPTNLLGSWAALISSVTGIWCVLLVAKGKISNYIWGTINVIFYAYAAFTWQLYGDFMLNAFYFLPMQFVGWYIWTKPKAKTGKDNVVSKFLSWKGRILWLAVSAALVVGYGFILQAMGGNTPFFDATSTVLSILAMVLMAGLFMEQWILWIVVDVVTVVMWANIVFNEGGMFNLGILVMWVSWTVNAIYGFVNWIKMHNKQEA